MKPLIILVIFIAIGTFFYQDNILPKTQTKFYSLLISIRQASPELDIPEGVFYKEIDGYNLYVEKKNPKTGMLYDVLIYEATGGFDNMAVIVCDSAEMSSTEDDTMLSPCIADSNSETTCKEKQPAANQEFHRTRERTNKR